MTTLMNFDELNRLSAQLWETVSQLPKEQQKKTVRDELFDLMVFYYLLGVQEVTMIADESERSRISPSAGETEELEGELEYDTSELYTALYKPVAGETFEQRVDKRVDEGSLDKDTLSRIVETECHRMNETGKFDKASRYEREGRAVNKIWKTMEDDRVRATHWYINDVGVPMSERFYTFDNDSARFPGDFMFPENNCNCRCWLEYQVY